MMYTIPLGSIIREHGLDFQMYADDTNIYISMNTSEIYYQTIESACLTDMAGITSRTSYFL